MVEGNKRGLLVTMMPNLNAELYEQTGPGRFARTQTAQSKSAVISLGDQAWPHLCDWDGDGDLDLLVGGGYGWPQIVINQGTRERPVYAESRNILSDGEPIRIIMSQVYPGCDKYRHNMGYPFPVFVDWDGDGLLDLIYSCAGSDSNGSIYLLRNVGTKKQPRFDTPRILRYFGEPIFVSAHGPHPWAGDLDGDGKPDLVTCVEWSVYPFYSHNALEMPQRPSFTVKTWVTRESKRADQSPRNP